MFLKRIIKYIVIIWICFFPPIAIHEVGHFIMAKATNLQTKEISIGFGPGLSKKFGDDTYSLRALPLGGFVRLENENIEIYHQEHLLTLLIGPINNLILAFLCFFIYYYFLFKNMLIIKDEKIIYFKFKNNSLFKNISSYYYKYDNDQTGIELISDLNLKYLSHPNHFRNALKFGLLKINIFAHKNKYFKNLSKIFFLQDKKIKNEALGPIGIIVEAVKHSDRSLLSLILFIGELSFSVGILNLLPIYPLDGGKIWPIILRIKESSPALNSTQDLNLLQMIGILTVLMFFTYIIAKDIGVNLKRLYNHWRKK